MLSRQKPSVLVPIVRATAESLDGYGNIVPDFDAEDIIRVTWPKLSGTRPIVPGTGNLQIPAQGNFTCRWVGDILYSDNLAVGVSFKVGNPFGKLLKEGSRDYVLVRDANYHPDSGQVFFPPSPGGRPYILLLARAEVGDGIRPEHFCAFFFDGSAGFHIAPGVWHYSPYIQPPLGSGDKAEMTFSNKQGSVFACVGADTVKEFGVYLKVPLTLDA